MAVERPMDSVPNNPKNLKGARNKVSKETMGTLNNLAKGMQEAPKKIIWKMAQGIDKIKKSNGAKKLRSLAEKVDAEYQAKQLEVYKNALVRFDEEGEIKDWDRQTIVYNREGTQAQVISAPIDTIRARIERGDTITITAEGTAWLNKRVKAEDGETIFLQHPRGGPSDTGRGGNLYLVQEEAMKIIEEARTKRKQSPIEKQGE